MSALSTSVLLVLVAVCLMVDAGLARRRLVWRAQRCVVCGRPRDRCVCRWR